LDISGSKILLIEDWFTIDLQFRGALQPDVSPAAHGPVTQFLIPRGECYLRCACVSPKITAPFSRAPTAALFVFPPTAFTIVTSSSQICPFFFADISGALLAVAVAAFYGAEFVRHVSCPPLNNSSLMIV